MWFKAVVMEIKDDYAIVMKSDSTMVRVKIKDNMKVGDVLIFLEEDIYIKKEKKSIKNKTILTIVTLAAAIALFILPILNRSTQPPYAVVSLDINPSIELELDENKKIVNVISMNEDGKKLDIEGIENLSLEEGITELKSILEENGYKLTNDSIIVGFTFLTDNEDVDYEDYIKSTLTNSLNNYKLAYLKGDKVDYSEANKNGVSLGRYEAQLNIDEDILEEELENMSVEELLDLLNNKNIYLNEEVREEIQDELEDIREAESEENEDNEEENDDYDDDDNDKEDDDDDE